jgi:hypothetical protein
VLERHVLIFARIKGRMVPLALALCFAIGWPIGILIGQAFKTRLAQGNLAQVQLESGTADTIGDPASRAVLDFDATAPLLPDAAPWCEQAAEEMALHRQAMCDASESKGLSHWDSFDEAEKESVDLLQAGEFKKIESFIACDAFDLTWYEITCESDLEYVSAQAIESVLDHAGPAALREARWKREVAEDVSPQSAQRSRLVSPLFELGEPWAEGEPHPESQTLLLLERRRDGKIYIGGVPMTGVKNRDKTPLE